MLAIQTPSRLYDHNGVLRHDSLHDLPDMKRYLVEEEAENGRTHCGVSSCRITLTVGGAAAASSVLLTLGCR